MARKLLHTRTLLGSLPTLLVLGILLVPTPNLLAQASPVQRLYPVGSLPAGVANATEDNDTALLVQYIGSAASGTVQVSVGDLLFKDGALAAEVATTDITGCGGTAGTLDVDNAACDTLGELVDRCNASAKWRCIQLDGLRSSATAANRLIDVAATAAKVSGGLGLKWDTSVAFHTTRALVPRIAKNIEFYYDSASGATLRANPFAGTQTFLTYLNETTTFGSGTSTIQCYSDVATFNPAGGTATEVLEYSIAGGATTVNKVISDFEFAPLSFQTDSRALCRVNNSAAASVPQLVASAVQTPSPNVPLRSARKPAKKVAVKRRR